MWNAGNTTEVDQKMETTDYWYALQGGLGATFVGETAERDREVYISNYLKKTVISDHDGLKLET